MINLVVSQDMRERLIKYLLGLSDKPYQESAWMRGGKTKYFYSNLRYPFQMIFDELLIDTDNEEIPYHLVGDILKSNQEAEALYKVAKILDDMVSATQYDYDEEYQTSPFWDPMVAAAKEAYDVFIANERDNKEFLQFLEEVKANMRQKIEERRNVVASDA